MASRLVPCPSCARHVKLGSGACPFCGGDVPTSPLARGSIAGRPLTRALLAFGAAAAASACGGTTKTPPKDAGEDVAFQAAYGGVIVPDAQAHEASEDDADMQVQADYGCFTDGCGESTAESSESSEEPSDDGGLK